MGGIELLSRRYGLDEEATGKLRTLARLLAEDADAPSAIRDPTRTVDDHLADSLVALELDPIRAARAVVDIGSGAGLPGVALAIALPSASFTLLEATGRRCAFLERALSVCAVENAAVVNRRAEQWPEGLGQFDLATARALAPLDVVLEYGAPLLRVGGTLAVWRGRREPGAEAAAARAARQLGLESGSITPVQPYPAAKNRHLYLTSKVMQTPSRFPRRPGIAAKRPLGSRLRSRGF